MHASASRSEPAAQVRAATGSNGSSTANPALASRLLLCTLLWAPAPGVSDDWRPVAEAPSHRAGADLYQAEYTAERPSDGRLVSARLAFFTSPAYRLEVVDLGDGAEPAYPSLAAAFRANGCVAGVNGGFFHPDWRPLGLVIAGARRINRFETSALLSGVVYSDARGTHIERRARFRDHTGIEALLQTGPYLVEHGRAVRGLSQVNPRRRTFIATDWRGHWALGATTTQLTLADLAEVLSSPGTLTPWSVERAINLDGGSSTGFFFDRGPAAEPVQIQPWKRVRNLLGVKRR
ncbi:MAG: phosphodiester glycosidase family protein [Gammaproteobacteria bacterium]|jgi:hypothetical protein|nr:phosphodiester glycosidase family protein [Gammaproteobacteria bacterium]